MGIRRCFLPTRVASTKDCNFTSTSGMSNHLRFSHSTTWAGERMQLTPQQSIRRAPLASNTPARPITSRPFPELAWYIASLALIAALGSLKLALPLHRDGATFLWLASQLDRGAVLYVDVWDVKQPGIFIFNYLAGKVFGFTAEGVHLFELLWHLAFAVVVIVALRSALTHRWLAAVAPAAFLAGSYVFCEAHQQTQLEI